MNYSLFHFRDSVITCVINTLTSLLAGVVTFSILGYLAAEQHTSVADVVKKGPGLVFLTYPEVVLKLPGSAFWASTFFIMLVVRTDFFCYHKRDRTTEARSNFS